jgi:hypothetical protein
LVKDLSHSLARPSNSFGDMSLAVASEVQHADALAKRVSLTRIRHYGAEFAGDARDPLNYHRHSFPGHYGGASSALAIGAWRAPVRDWLPMRMLTPAVSIYGHTIRERGL